MDVLVDAFMTDRDTILADLPDICSGLQSTRIFSSTNAHTSGVIFVCTFALRRFKAIS
jgi:hypothetical protein